MTFSQLLMVTNNALKLDYASVIFVDAGVNRRNITWCMSYARSLVVHVSARLWLSAYKKNASLHVFHKIV